MGRQGLPRLTGSQLKLLLVVLRQTEGHRDARTGGRKAEDWLTHRRLMAKTGCASQTVSGAGAAGRRERGC